MMLNDGVREKNKKMRVNLTFDESVFNHKKRETIIITRGKTVAEILDAGIKKRPVLESAIFDTNGDLSTGILIKLNGQFVHSNQLASLVKGGDTIEVLKFDG